MKCECGQARRQEGRTLSTKITGSGERRGALRTCPSEQSGVCGRLYPCSPPPHTGHALQLRERGSRHEPPVLVRRGQSNPAHFVPTCFSFSFMLLRGCKRLPKSRRKRCVGCGVCGCVCGLSCALGGGREGPRSRNDVSNPFSILLVGQC